MKSATPAAEKPTPVESLEELELRFLECNRSNQGHRWGSISAIPEEAPPSALFWARNGDLWMDVCDRCGGTRYRGIDRLGHIAWRHYDWPDGYSLVGRKSIKGAEFRLELIRRRKVAAKKAARVPRA